MAELACAGDPRFEVSRLEQDTTSYSIETIDKLLPRLAPRAGWVSLRPRQFDTLAIVHRAGATLSPAARLMIELATARIQAIATPVRPR